MTQISPASLDLDQKGLVCQLGNLVISAYAGIGSEAFDRGWRTDCNRASHIIVRICGSLNGFDHFDEKALILKPFFPVLLNGFFEVQYSNLIVKYNTILLKCSFKNYF